MSAPNNRKFYNVAHAGPFRCIDKPIGHCHLIWEERRQKENFPDAIKRAGKRAVVFKIECRQRDVSAELFSCFGLIANGGPYRHSIFRKYFYEIPSDRAGCSSYQNSFLHESSL